MTFKCTECGSSYEHEQFLNVHTCKKEKPTKCEICKDFAELLHFNLTEKMAIKMHIELVHDSKIQCKACGKWYTHSKEKPIYMHNPQIFLCSNCHDHSYSKIESNDTASTASTASADHIVTRSSPISARSTAAASTASTAPTPSTASTPSTSFTPSTPSLASTASTATPVRVTMTPIPPERATPDRACELCGHVPDIKQLTAFAKHRQVHLATKQHYGDVIDSHLPSAELFCPFLEKKDCKMTTQFKNKKSLKSHLVLFHRIAEDLLDKDIKKGIVKVFKCDTCNVSFANLEPYLYHMASWHNAFRCYVCGNHFASHFWLGKHFSLTHADLDSAILATNLRQNVVLEKERPVNRILYECTICDYKSATLEVLQQHLVQFHSVTEFKGLHPSVIPCDKDEK